MIRVIVGVLFIACAVAVFDSTSRLGQFLDEGYRQYFLTCNAEFLREPADSGGSIVTYPSYVSDCIQYYYRDPSLMPVDGLTIVLIIAGAIVLLKKNSLANIITASSPVPDSDGNRKMMRKKALLEVPAIAYLAVGSLLVFLTYETYALYLSEEREHEKCFATSGIWCSRVFLEGNYYRDYSLFSILAAICFSVAAGLMLVRWKQNKLLQAERV